jgi:hypothetical protein
MLSETSPTLQLIEPPKRRDTMNIGVIKQFAKITNARPMIAIATIAFRIFIIPPYELVNQGLGTLSHKGIINVLSD